MAVLEYRDTDGQFKKLIIPGGSGGGTSNTEYLSDIKDVKITNPEKDQILVYDDTTKTWINKKNGAIAELPNNIAYITDSSETKEIKIRANQHNYSTEEQVVGTWIDGKPIYEKVIPFITTLNQNIWVETPELINDKEQILQTFGISNTSYISLMGNIDRNDSSYVRIWNLRNTIFPITHVTIQYTKTTD